MINIIPTAGLSLSTTESLLEKAGFECFPRGDNHYCFRRFFRLSELQLLWKYRLKRHGVQESHEVSLAYSEVDNLISACVVVCDLFIEFDADSPQGKNLMWGFGLELPASVMTPQKEAS